MHLHYIWSLAPALAIHREPANPNMVIAAFVRATNLLIAKDVHPTHHHISSYHGIHHLRRTCVFRVLPVHYNPTFHHGPSHKISTYNPPTSESHSSPSRTPKYPHMSILNRHLSRSSTPTHNVHVVIFSNFATNPMLAIRDRLSDPVFVVILVVTALFVFVIARVTAPRAKTSPSFVSPVQDATSQISSNISTFGTNSTMQDSHSTGAAGNSFPPLAAPTPGESAIWLNMRSVICIPFPVPSNDMSHVT